MARGRRSENNIKMAAIEIRWYEDVNYTEMETSSNDMLCDKYNKYPGYETTENVKVTVFWDMTCIMVDRYWRFRGTCCLLLHVE
jgi:hypothetical protein